MKAHRIDSNRPGFTLIEVLATLMLMAIVLPVVMEGISMGDKLADGARRRTEAAGLAEQKLNEIVATSQWQQGNLSGDFGNDWPDYRWDVTAQAWVQDNTGEGIQQIDLRVLWQSAGHENSLTVSTLAYPRTQQ